MKPSKYILGKLAFQILFKKMHRLSLKGMNYGYANNYQENGEVFALKEVKRILKKTAKEPLVLIDVGANVGKYSASVFEVFKDTAFKLHVLEPSPSTFKTLKETLGHHENIFYHNAGLSNESTTATLYTNEEKNTLASLYDRNLAHTSLSLSQKETIQLTTLDVFCENYNIKKIDFMKIDVEGHELSVFEGATKMLQSNSINIIQFEFGGCNIDSRTYFKDFFLLLSEKYELYRIVRNGLFHLPSYSEEYEIFQSSNFIAILKEGH